jgi:myo-inositol-1(or 4)-monophosphatase
MTVKDARLSMAMSLARTAGTAIRRRDLRRTARWKRPGERVTAEDLLTQADLVRQLGTRFPSDGVLAEEGIRSFYLDREFVWVIDPLDGTNNYALGIPCFAVSIGILRAGQPYAGVTHDPNTGFTCFATAGRGAFAWLSRYKLRSFGSVALNLAYAALGAIDVVLDDRAAIWDVAAAAVILPEAGAVITDFAGRPLFPRDLTGSDVQRLPFVAGNPTAHAGALADIGDLTGL